MGATTFESFITQQVNTGRGRRRGWVFGVSLFLHGAVLVVGVLHSAWRVEVIPPPELPVMLFAFAAPAAPPPPPPAAAATRRVVRTRPRPTEVVQPTPQVAPAVEEPAEEPGEPGGQPGGVPGGVVGGTGTGPGAGQGSTTFLNPTVARGQLAIDPHADPYRVKLPPALARAGVALWALVRICVDQHGRVASVDILKGADPAVDPLIKSVLATWRYKPYTINGRPVPFCSNVRYAIAVG
jgi:periplasmic protein TonB